MIQGTKPSTTHVYNTFFSTWLARFLSAETRPIKERCSQITRCPHFFCRNVLLAYIALVGNDGSHLRFIQVWEPLNILKARSTGHVGHFFSKKKYCVTCKKSTLKVLINFGFVTSFEDSHHTLLFRYIYGARVIQWFCYSKHLHVNCCSCRWSKWSIAMSLSPKCYSANVPLDFCTTADFEIKYFFNEGTAGILGNT